MECKNEHFRYILFFYFREGKNAAQAAKKLRDVYREEASVSKLVLGIFHSKTNQIKATIESDRHVTVREIEGMLKIPKSTIDRHIQRLGLVKKLYIWIPHGKKFI